MIKEKAALSQKIIEFRKEKNLSQKQLAIKLGVSYSTISYWENGKKTPENVNLLKLSEILEKPLDYFLIDEDIEYSNKNKKNISKNNIKLRLIANIRNGDLTYQIDKDNKVIYDIVSTYQLNGMDNGMTKDEIESNFSIFENPEQFERFNKNDKMIIKQTKEEIENGLYVIYDDKLRIIRNDGDFDFEKNKSKIIGVVIKIYFNPDYIAREQVISL